MGFSAAAEDRDEAGWMETETEPVEFDCPHCHGPAHCRVECDRRFAVLQQQVDAWHELWKQVRDRLPVEVRWDSDLLVEPF